MSLSIFGVLGLAIRRLRSRPWLTLLSLLGIVLCVGLVVSIPVFAQGVSYLVLRDEMADLNQIKNRAPLTMRFYYALRRQAFPLSMVYDLDQKFGQIVEEKTGLKVRDRTIFVEGPTMFLRSTPDGPHYDEEDPNLLGLGLSLIVLGDVEPHLTIVEGDSLSEAVRSDRLPVWVHSEMANLMGLHVGETFNLFTRAVAQPVTVYIAGIWQVRDANDRYWGGPSFSRKSVFLVTPEDYERYAEPLFPDGTAFSAWYYVPDEKHLTVDKVDAFAHGVELLPTIIDSIVPQAKMDVSPIEPMRRYLQRRDDLTTLLVNFSVPAMGLLLYFLSLLSTVIVQFQREETAILGGRGASRSFVLTLAGLESIILLVMGIPLGIGMGYVMARLMGYTSGFLTFISRPPLQTSLQAINWRLVGLALVLLIAMRFIPTLNAVSRSVVVHLRERSRPPSVSWATKLAVDIPLVVMTLYAYRQLRVQEVPSLIRMGSKADLLREPLFLIAPLLCVLTSALVLAHLFPVIMRPLDALSRRLPWFSVYMGMRRLYGQSGQYTNALFLVIICLSLGAFYSSMSLSLTRWLKDRTYYAVGADYTFRQEVRPVEPGIEQIVAAASFVGDRKAGAWVLPVTDYLKIPGVEAATRVGEFEASAQTPRISKLRVRFLGIDRLTFPHVAFYRSDFATDSLGELLNRLGQYRNGVLVSRQFLKNNNVLEGQRLKVDIVVGTSSQQVEVVVVGIYDYFPTAFPKKMETLVGNLDYLFEQTGDPSIYNIWLRTAPGTDGDAIEKAVLEMGVLPADAGDAQGTIRKDTERVEWIGVFGVLTVGFLAGSVLSWLGLLVYTSASMQGRMQQIGVLKAIGVQTLEALIMETVEYTGVIVYGILGGIAAGVLVSHLFVPFFQFNVTAWSALPPFIPYIDWGNIKWFALVFAVALILSEGAILYQATRKDIFQALRMGQRE